jgi:hypothetical protein
MPFLLQLLVPLQSPLPPRLFVQLTCVTATLSEAVPAMSKEILLVLWVGFDVGEVIDIKGLVVSRV